MQVMKRPTRVCDCDGFKYVNMSEYVNMSKNTTYEIFPIKIGSYVSNDHIKSVVKDKCFQICKDPKSGTNNTKIVAGPALNP